MIIFGSSCIVLNPVDKMVYGYVVMAVCSYALDAVLSETSRSAQMLIFPAEFEEFVDFINQQQYRGVTVVDGIGWYIKENMKIVITVVRKKETGTEFRKSSGSSGVSKSNRFFKSG